MRYDQETDSREKLIEQVWDELGATSVGEFELLQIENVLRRNLGEDAVVSPAWIARVLAERGVRLRHPEILRTDERWRSARLFDLFAPGELSFDNLSEAEASMAKLESLRLAFKMDNDSKGLQRLRAIALGYKAYLKMLVEAQNLDDKRRVAEEVSDWITVWLQNPLIFANWLDLRRNSPQFLEQFRR